MSERKEPPKSAEELLERYAAGERDFSRWRDQSQNVHRAKLKCANLRRTNLKEINLRGADMQSSDLEHANFRYARLDITNLVNSNLTLANLRNVNLRDAKLEGAVLSRASLRNARLDNANLCKSNLIDTNFLEANLSNARLVKADLRLSRLMHTCLLRTNLSGSNLAGVNFEGANLEGAVLQDSELRGANFERAALIGMRLSDICRAVNLNLHHATIDFRSIALSCHEPELPRVLRESGYPEPYIIYAIEAAKAMSTADLTKLLQTVFISYGGPDEAFAERLNNALKKQGVNTFFFPETAVPGQRLSRMMRTEVRKYDRVILVCSEQSLNRKGVLNEITELLDREAEEGGEDLLIPIRLDDYLFTGWNPPRPDIAESVRRRVVADFRDCADERKFNAAVGRVVRALVPVGRGLDR